MTRYSSNTSYDKLELYFYLEFYLADHLLNHRIQVKQSTLNIKYNNHNIYPSLTKRNSPIPRIPPLSTAFAVSVGFLYINKTTPEMYSKAIQ
jgi:hypothetical protein